MMGRTVFVDNLKDASQKREEENEDGAEEEKTVSWHSAGRLHFCTEGKQVTEI